MKNIILLILLISFFVDLPGQNNPVNLNGKVSFVSSSNVYVKFSTTKGISSGDTLFISSGTDLIPVLKVTNLSSTSCVCISVSNKQVSVGDLIIANNELKTVKKRAELVVNKPQENFVPVVPVVPAVVENENVSPDAVKQKIRGSLSAYSFTDFSNTSAPSSTRLRYTFSIDARNIGNSKFSFENYMSFNHKIGDWAAVQNDLFHALKIYSLAVKYDINKTSQVSIGRRINPNLSNIGAMDGIQFDKSIKKFNMGVLAGFRPDFSNYGFNANLFQYGAYVGLSNMSPDSYNETSLAFMQQTNNGKTDRRFAYFQHSNSLIKNVFFMGTFEVDLYEMTTDSLGADHPKNNFNPTGLYLSLRYRLTNRFTLSGSYDARKNVMYYETYKSYIDRILESEIRQGYRLNANWSITNNLFMGLQGGYRFLKSDPNPSRNLYGYMTYNEIPGIKMSATLSATYLESSYMNGNIYGLTLSRDFAKGKVQTGIGYRYVDYNLPENQLSVPQDIAEMNLSFLIAKSIWFSANYEGTFEKTNQFNRVYFQIRLRF